MHLLRQRTRQACSPGFEFPSAALSSEWICCSSFKKMASDTCCFCAEGIIVLLGLMVPLKLSVVFSHVGELLCSVPVPRCAVQLPFCTSVQAGSCFSHSLIFCRLAFPLGPWYWLTWERPLLCSSCYERGVDNGGQTATRLEESFASKGFLCTGFKPQPGFSMV